MGWPNWFKNIRGSTFQLNDDDIVVFVVGPSGSGKSAFVRAVTQARSLVEVGQSLRPCTGKVQAVRCELTEAARTALGAGERKDIVFVDTPSFHTAVNNGAEKETNTWLKKSKSRPTHVGTIYMHRAEVDPNADKGSSIQKHLDTFAYTFPQDFIPQAFPARLHCVFSHVDNVNETTIEDHQDKFQKQLSDLHTKIVHGWRLRWNTSTHPDLFVKSDPATAWKAVEALFSHPGSP